MASKKLVLHFPKEITDKPIVYKLIKDYNLVFNILRAQVSPEKEGMLVIEITGKQKDIDKGVKYLEKNKVKIQPLSKDIERDEKKCTHCSACIVHCPTGALYIKDRKTDSLKWEENNTVTRIIFSEKLSYSTTYFIMFDQFVEDYDGNGLEGPFKLEFTTEGIDQNGRDGYSDNFLDNISLIGIIFGLLILIISIIIFAFISKNRRKAREEIDADSKEYEGRVEVKSKIAEEYRSDEILPTQSEEYILKLKDEALVQKKPSDFSISEKEILNEIRMKYRKREISKDTYNSIKAELLKHK